MAPVKPRFSIRSYAGKKKPKQSLLFTQMDPFDNLLPNQINTSRVFESSSDQPNSSQSRNDSMPSTSRVLSDSGMSGKKTKRGSGCVKKKRVKETKVDCVKMLNEMKKLSLGDSDNEIVQLVASTPKLNAISRFKDSCSPFSNLISNVKIPINESSDSFTSVESPLNVLKHSPIISKSKIDLSSVNEGNFFSDDSSSSSKRHNLINSDRSFKSSDTQPESSLSSRTRVDSSVLSSSNFSEIVDEMSPSPLKSPVVSESLSSQDLSRYERYSDCSKDLSCETLSDSICDDHQSLQEIGDLSSNHPEILSAKLGSNEDSEDNNSRSVNKIDIDLGYSFTTPEYNMYPDRSEYNPVKYSVTESLERLTEEALADLSYNSENRKTPSPDRITVRRRRRNWGCSRHIESISPSDPMSEVNPMSPASSGRGMDIDKRRLYHRLSKSLPASFKDCPPSFYTDRFTLSEIDLCRSKKSLASKLTCSSRSLPAVLEGQETSAGEELEMPRNYFRKSSYDSSYSKSPFFLGFSSSEVSKAKRTYAIKKLNSEDLSSISPHTLPSLPEDESYSSCEEDESKRLESGSSSQLESPLMSPGVQGSPSRRTSTKIPTSNSSETSLSSRSEGLTSPLQDEMGNILSPRASSPDIAACSSEEDSGSSPVRRDEQRRRRPSRLTSSRTLGYIAEETELDSSEPTNLPNVYRERLMLMPGKKCRRSLAIIHSLMGEESVMYEHKGRNYVQSVEVVKQLQNEETFHVDSDDSSDMSPDPRRSVMHRSILSKSRSNRYTSIYCVNSNPVDLSVVCSKLSCLPISESVDESIQPVEPNENIAECFIYKISNQEEPMALNHLYQDGSFDTWKKIGEGVYSEVFSLSREDENASVLKIIPIDGETIVNGGAQKSLEENLPEVLISFHLSRLREIKDHFCEGFVQLVKVWYLEGPYTEELIELWNDFDVNYGSDNDRPTIFPEDQRYLGLELVNSGRALEAYTFSSARQSLAIFKQVVFSVAAAECYYEFEHRDLHWGNVLVDKSKQKTLEYIIEGNTYSVATNGVRATIIDYTWSSLTDPNNKIRIVNDMEQDPDLFLGMGDLQFDVYRQMREDVNQDWNRYQPKTNLRWLFYLADKLINQAKYLRPAANAHKTGISSLQKILKFIPNCDNSLQVALEVQHYK